MTPPPLNYQSAARPVGGDPFGEVQYVVRQKVFKLFGNAFHVYDPQGRVVLYSKQKAFKLREDIRLYTGEDMATELLAIRTEKILDIGATYKVFDSASGVLIGMLKRKGLKSILRDEWMILDPAGVQYGRILEESGVLAIVRRVIDWAQFIAPQCFNFDVQGQPVARMTQNRNPFVRKLTCDFTLDPSRLLDRRIALAAAILLSAIEGRQQA